MINRNFTKVLLTWTFILFVSLYTNYTFAQCAGSDGTVTVCEKDTDTANKTFDLFPFLQGTPTTGGLWSTNDPANFFALDRNTGILNLWDIKNSGAHTFTYTNSGCNESATVTINLGGYPGENNIDGSADVCGDDPAVNLHSFIGDVTDGKFQDFNGTWDAITPTAAAHLQDNFFDAESAGPGMYEFRHTVPAVSTCPSREIRLLLEVQRPANSGIASSLTVCSTDDLSGHTNYSLNALLFDEDVNGTWAENSGTNQLDNLIDNTINIEEIRDSKGHGTYTFEYTVYPSHAVCTLNSTEVEITILPSLSGTIEAVNYCQGSAQQTFNITNYNTALIPDGTYTATYALTTAATTTVNTTSLILKTDGTGSFEINNGLVTLNEITTLTIQSLDASVCPDVQVNPIEFVMSSPEATVTDTCQEKDFDVSLASIFDASLSLANGNYDITCIITTPSAIVETYTLTDVLFSSGTANFSIPASEIDGTGDYSIEFDIDNGFPLDCQIKDDATITPFPTNIDLDLIVDNSCNATNINVNVNAPQLASGSYTVSYDVRSQENSTILINNSINFTGGTASYEIDVSTLSTGNYTVNVHSTQTDTSPCRVDFDFEQTANFAIEGIPAIPTAESVQYFCMNLFPILPPTLEDINVSASGDILFYATENDTFILPIDTILVDGETYYISNINSNNNCEGSNRIPVTVQLERIEAPEVVIQNLTFCASENATIVSLNNSISITENIIWYDQDSNGVSLSSDTLLENGKSYFAAVVSTAQCQSTLRSEAIVTIYALEPAAIQFNNLALCGLDNPTISNLRDIEGSNSFEVLWYDSPESESPLDNTILLITDSTYYAESFNPETGCINPERVAITVDLTNCEPEEYDFFIPDGFSPNGDNRNDTFFIPNIEVIFPDFTLEIINRYGTTLFKGDKDNPAWNGSNGNGKALNGVYFYIIDYNKDGHKPIQGRLYLNR